MLFVASGFVASILVSTAIGFAILLAMILALLPVMIVISENKHFQRGHESRKNKAIDIVRVEWVGEDS
jgi:hypothetical protein